MGSSIAEEELQGVTGADCILSERKVMVPYCYLKCGHTAD